MISIVDIDECSPNFCLDCILGQKRISYILKPKVWRLGLPVQYIHIQVC